MLFISCHTFRTDIKLLVTDITTWFQVIIYLKGSTPNSPVCAYGGCSLCHQATGIPAECSVIQLDSDTICR